MPNVSIEEAQCTANHGCCMQGLKSRRNRLACEACTAKGQDKQIHLWPEACFSDSETDASLAVQLTVSHVGLHTP